MAYVSRASASTMTGLPWLGIILFIVLSFSYLLPIQPNDYWWYVRLGDEIILDRTIPSVDTFTYTQAGQPIVYHSWLAAVIFASGHAVGGNTVAFLLRGLLLVIHYALIWQICRLGKTSPLLASGITLLAVLAGSHNWAMRPQLFSLPLFALTLTILWQWQQGKRVKLWLLPLIVLAWVNLHGAYVLSFLLIGAAFVGGGGNRRPLLLMLLGMLVASLFNPRNIGAWEYVITLISNPPSQQLGAEWRPPTLDNWQGVLFYGWILSLLPLAIFSKARLSLTQWLWFLGFGAMALYGLRYVIWFLAIAAPMTAQLLTPLIAARRQTRSRRLRRGYIVIDVAFVIILIVLSIPLVPGLRDFWWADAPADLSKTTPVNATNWLQTQPDLPNQLWADLAFSSYLIYALPNRPVWIDTRFELFPLDQWQTYIAISEADANWQAKLDEAGVSLMMIDPQMQPNLMKALEASSSWQERYQDDTAIIYTREADRGN